MSRQIRFGQLATSDTYNITGSLFGTSSWAQSASYSLFAITSSFSNSSSFALANIYTASVNDATITFIRGDLTTFPLIINNVVNSISSSYAVTASYALNGGGSGIGFPYSGSAIITGSLEIKSNINDILLIKNFNNAPILTVSQSGVIIIATQSQDPIGTALNGALYFTSASFFVGLE